ncbi:5'/3'-nucleotidase SurE [Cellulomonas bogoriensis]|uniref:5'-nucleotidase n=1 Tax=Cellulomonas bogoriensis 69B4 = DSM 16987 TaxID=1386082 RepID=A0A0A0BZS7_9CELL|nr:5'/3'-nucleotidase SurE [Cellulomonas bogoriensis]KGM13441.1 5'-nucleotidase [Cellulomonas bogoriensis 69B4 = DSM 16987]
MRALITNDDGIASPGLAVLVDVALEAGYEVVVAAPARESSGASASLLGAERDGTLLVDPTRAPGVPDHVTCYAVRAAPALIAFLAAHDGFGPRPDVVLSGVNLGANTGHAVIHSGTVGAALSAMTHGIHGLAVSVASARPRHWDTVRGVAARGLRWLTDRPARGGVLNVNVPDVPADRLEGVRSAPLASFGAVQARVHEVDRGQLMVTYSEIDPARDAESDAGLLARGWATMTLLQAPCFDPDADIEEVTGPL